MSSLTSVDKPDELPTSFVGRLWISRFATFFFAAKVGDCKCAALAEGRVTVRKAAINQTKSEPIRRLCTYNLREEPLRTTFCLACARDRLCVAARLKQ